MTDAPSAGGRPFLNITIVDVEDGEGRWDFYEHYREPRLAMARAGGYAYFEPHGGGGKGNYIEGNLIWQPQARDCRYNVVEHAYPSWNAPGDYGFVISMGICEADLPVYGRQRDVILGSFNEIE